MNLTLWQRLLGRITGKRMYLAIGSAFADDSHSFRNQGERHAFLAYVWETQANVAKRIFFVLDSEGWKLPQIDNCKELNLPLESADSAQRNAFQAAVKGDIGLLIYSNTDPA